MADEPVKDTLNAMIAAAKTFQEKFAKADVADQKKILDHAEAIIKGVDADSDMAKELDADPALKAAFKQKRDEFEKGVNAYIAVYNKTNKLTYTYEEPEDVKGAHTAKEQEKAAGEAGDWVHKEAVVAKNKVIAAKDWFVGLFSSDGKDAKKDDKDKKDATKDDKSKKEEKPAVGTIDPKTGKLVEEEKKGFFDDLHAGDMLGGLVGAILGFMTGSMFGGGWIGIIMGTMLAIGGMLLGKRALGSKIDGWLGRTPPPDTATKGKEGPDLQKQPDGPKQGNDKTVTANQPNAANPLLDTNQTIADTLTPEQKRIASEAFQNAYIESTGHAYTPPAAPSYASTPASANPQLRQADTYYTR